MALRFSKPLLDIGDNCMTVVTITHHQPPSNPHFFVLSQNLREGKHSKFMADAPPSLPFGGGSTAFLSKEPSDAFSTPPSCRPRASWESRGCHSTSSSNYLLRCRILKHVLLLNIWCTFQLFPFTGRREERVRLWFWMFWHMLVVV